jgi:hypothetical protein
MHKALHPLNKEKLMVPDYIREFGHNVDDPRLRPRCPICKQQMKIVAASSPGAIGHFAHMPRSGYCPSKTAAAAPYLGLYPKNPDPEAARRLKRAFVENWEQHFLHLDWIVKALHYNEFIEIIRLANRERIWEYSRLEEFQLPYVFATLTDFAPKSGRMFDGQPLRKHWFRCWFDSDISRFDDLWIERQSPAQFWRCWYTVPKTGRPKASDMVDSYCLEMSSDFLENSKQPHPIVVMAVNKWLERNLLPKP